MLKVNNPIIRLALLIEIIHTEFFMCHRANADAPKSFVNKPGIYVKGVAGALMSATQFNKDSHPKDQFSLLAGAGIGYRISNNLRLDLIFAHKGNYGFFEKREVQYSPDPNDLGPKEGEWNVTTNLWMISGYYDIPTQSMFTPYITAGIGVALHKIKDSNFVVAYKGYKYAGASEKAFAWSAGVGSLYKIRDKISLDFSYRYTDMGKVIPSYYYYFDEKVKSNVKDQGALRTHDISLGVIISL